MAAQENEVQNLQLRLIEMVEYNDLDGKRVAKDLRSNRALWRAAVMDSERIVEPGATAFGPVINLIKLRDLPDGIWNVDTLFLLPAAGRENELEAMTETWKADEIVWIGGEEAGGMLGTGAGGSREILRLWWD